MKPLTEALSANGKILDNDAFKLLLLPLLFLQKQYLQEATRELLKDLCVCVETLSIFP